MTTTEFFAHAGAFTVGYFLAFAGIRLVVVGWTYVTHWYDHWKNGTVHLSEEEWQDIVEEFLDNYDESIFDPEKSRTMYGVCRKCRKMKKNFVGEGRKRMCMDCAYGDTNG